MSLNRFISLDQSLEPGNLPEFAAMAAKMNGVVDKDLSGWIIKVCRCDSSGILQEQPAEDVVCAIGVSILSDYFP